MDDDNQESSSINVIYLISMLLISSLSFYFQAVVTEERLVPALNVIAKWLSFSDDVAGATLMAAGASAPELFANIVSIFTNSAIGMGCIVGSEIFNQLVIGAGAIFAAKNNTLKLNSIVVSRDVGFYFLSLLILVWAISDRRVVANDDEGRKIVYVSTLQAGVLFGSYCLYVIVCANFSKWFGPTDIPKVNDNYVRYEAFEVSIPANVEQSEQLKRVSSLLPFVREPPENFHQISDDIDDTEELYTSSSVLTELYSETSSSSFIETKSTPKKSHKDRATLFLLDKFKPGLNDLNDIEDIERKDEYCQFYLWQQSKFYDMCQIDMNAWQLRWFTFANNKILSLPRRRPLRGEKDDIFMLPLITSLEKNQDRLLLKVTTSHRDYLFLAPSDAIFAAALRRFEEFLHLPVLETKYSEEITETPEYHSSLIEFPVSGSFVQKFFYLILLPLNAMIHYVIPDVRFRSIAPMSKAILSTVLSTVYLILGSLVMIDALSRFSEELHVPESFVGETISAAGTSIPAYIASQIAARQGLGNMAISNVFGSNTFNISVALGLPWFLYAGLNGGYYSELPDEGLTESMLALATALIIFIVLIICTKFHLRLWHAYYFLALYFLFVLRDVLVLTEIV